MLVKRNDTTFHVTWRYMKNDFGDPTDSICLISKLNTDGTKETIVTGTATCNIVDQFDRNVGRKLSFSRALLTQVPQTTIISDNAGKFSWSPIFPREDRIAFWDEYFKMRGKKS